MMIYILGAPLLVCVVVALWLLSGRRIEDGGVLLVGLLALVGSWCVVFVWVAGMTEGWLVPWDTTAARPAPGTWQRTVNDFFEGSPGSVLPSWAVVGGSAGIFAIRFARPANRPWLPWVCATLNGAFVVALLLGGIFAWWLPPLDLLRAPGVANDLGFHRTWAHLALALALLIALFLAQSLIRVGQRQPSPGVASQR